MQKQNNSAINAHLLRAAFFVLLFLAVGVIPFALAQRGSGKRPLAPRGTCPTPWTFIADMPVDLYGAACASDGTSIYCAGGYSFSFPGLVPQLIRYDPGTNTWTALAPIPVPSSMASAVYYPPTNKIYVFGGSDPDAQTVNNLNQIYDIASNTWSTGTPLPDLRAFMASGYSPDNGKIYLVGGYNTAFVDSGQPNTWEYDPIDDTYTNKTNVYVPDTDEWRTSANLNVFRAFPSGAAIGTNVYAAGGYDGTIGFTVASAEVLAACVPEPTPTPCPGDQYTITDGADTIVPGDTDTGSHCDDCDTVVTLPFPFQLYGQGFVAVNVSSNGRLDFVIPNEPGGFVTACLPAPPNIGPYDYTIFTLWEDMRTDFGLSGCASFPGGNCGVFTSVTGSAPNRIFNIEWRTVLFADNSATQNFEVRLYENDPLKTFEVIVGDLTPASADHPWVSGVQGLGDLGIFTQNFCIDPPGSPLEFVSHTYTSPGCGTPTPTPTPSPTPTVTPTPTPRPIPTPRPRPTPHPRPTP